MRVRIMAGSKATARAAFVAVFLCGLLSTNILIAGISLHGLALRGNYDTRHLARHTYAYAVYGCSFGFSNVVVSHKIACYSNKSTYSG
jgi:hypothetical protein